MSEQLPASPPQGMSDRVLPVDHFKRMPTGGTVFTSPPTPSIGFPVGSRFREMPNGGGTVYQPGGGDGGEEGNKK